MAGKERLAAVAKNIALGIVGIVAILGGVAIMATDSNAVLFLTRLVATHLRDQWPTAVAAMCIAAYVAGSLTRNGSLFAAAELARNEARAQAQPALENEGLQERAVDLHVARLNSEIEALRRRAFGAFLPGILLCVGSAAGPWVAVELARAHPEHWQYMLGGSATALVLLGAGSALLRHDAKLREQLISSKSELLYFSRIQTGLDCARALGVEEYTKGLVLVTAHLLAAPPSLVASKSAPGEKTDGSAATKTENDNAERQALDLLLDAVKPKADKA
jgi:hypothetical protein